MVQCSITRVVDVMAHFTWTILEERPAKPGKSVQWTDLSDAPSARASFSRLPTFAKKS
jgi:hypothetical protein